EPAGTAPDGAVGVVAPGLRLEPVGDAFIGAGALPAGPASAPCPDPGSIASRSYRGGSFSNHLDRSLRGRARPALAHLEALAGKEAQRHRLFSARRELEPLRRRPLVGPGPFALHADGSGRP